MLRKAGESDQATTMTGRIVALDRARTFITLLVVIHHSVVNFTHFGNGDRMRWLGFDLVVLFNDQIEAEPTHPVAIAEMGEVDDGMVDHHQQRDEGARPIERHDAPRHRGGLIALAGFSQHGFRPQLCQRHFSNAS